MVLKSHIDWNEIFPLFTERLRQDMFAEAMILMSDSVNPTTASTRKYTAAARGLRVWSEHTDGHALFGDNRIYKILGTSKLPTHGKLRKVWDEVLATKKSTLSALELGSIIKKQAAQPASTVNQLWARRNIEVV